MPAAAAAAAAAALLCLTPAAVAPPLRTTEDPAILPLSILTAIPLPPLLLQSSSPQPLLGPFSSPLPAYRARGARPSDPQRDGREHRLSRGPCGAQLRSP